MIKLINPEHLFISNYWVSGAPKEFNPGMLLELINGDFILVGHVNQIDGGSCGCCGKFIYSDDMATIKRWIKVIDFY